LAESVGILPERITVVHPGTDISEIDSTKASEFRSRFGFGSLPLLLSVGRITERKGLLPFLRNAWPKVLERHPDAQLVVIGSEPKQALRKDRRSALADIRAYLSESGLERSVRFLGRVDDVTLTAAYQAANVHVFPVLDGPDDVEGFGMVAIEAAANGLPTVAFDAGGVSDAVDQGHSGQLLTAGDYEGFAAAVLSSINNRLSIQIQNEIKAKFGWISFSRNLEKTIFQH
jgi:phosphatidylinositol alpha-1,6-mannosyltransferase